MKERQVDKSVGVRDRPSSREDREIPTTTPNGVMTDDLRGRREGVQSIHGPRKLTSGAS